MNSTWSISIKVERTNTMLSWKTCKLQMFHYPWENWQGSDSSPSLSIPNSLSLSPFVSSLPRSQWLLDSSIPIFLLILAYPACALGKRRVHGQPCWFHLPPSPPINSQPTPLSRPWTQLDRLKISPIILKYSILSFTLSTIIINPAVAPTTIKSCE